jgi:hypothetical protein
LPKKAAGGSFSSAIKHLFRHLHDPAMLRKNPLVQRFFEEPANERAGYVTDRARLDRIHQLVRQAAERCRDDDLISGNSVKAHRQYAIVTWQCLERQPIQSVAQRLGISTTHCYHQRAEICRRIARYISDRSDEASALDYFPELDEFQLLVDRVYRLAEFGDKVATLKQCDELIETAPSELDRIAAYYIGVSSALHFGDLRRAKEMYRQAALYSTDLIPSAPADRELGGAYNCLMEYKLAHYGADTAQTFRSAEAATCRLERVQAGKSPHVRRLYPDSLYCLGAAHVNLGRSPEGYECMVLAQRYLERLDAPVTLLRARVTIVVWRLRNYLLTSATSWHPSWQRLKGLATAFHQAYAAGLLSEATSALVALTEYHAFAGNDAEALRVARMTIALADRQGERTRAERSVEVAMLILLTRNWAQASSLIRPAPNDSCNVYHQEMLSFFAAEDAFRRGRLEEAWALTNGGGTGRREHAALSAGRQLLAASVAHALARRREANGLLEMGIASAKRIGTAPTLLDAYAVAARVTGEPRFKRRANEIARLLTA